MTSQQNPLPARSPSILFINGFPRSGTTLMAAATTAAVSGVTTTAGIVARHVPALAAFLASMPAGGVDRGVDRLTVTPDTVEEYGYLLHQATGERALYAHRDGLGVLRAHVTELAAEAPDALIVLKNPQEMGHEARILRDFPEAGILMLRRHLPDIEESVQRAMRRAADSAGYPLAVTGRTVPDGAVAPPSAPSMWRRATLRVIVRVKLCYWVVTVIRALPSLPPERVAFLCYEELRDDPRTGARWAGHLLNPDALAEAYRERAFTERSAATHGSWIVRMLDRSWARAWERARQAQVDAGVLAPRQA